MNLQHRQFARMDGLAGYDDGEQMAGLGKKLKQARRKIGKVARKVSSGALVKKIAPKPYAKARKVGQKTEKFAKRNGIAIAGAVATIATGGAAAPALIAALQKTAASEIMRKVAQKRGKKQQKKMIGKANAEADQQAAQYEADLDRQDAAAGAQGAMPPPDASAGGGSAGPSGQNETTDIAETTGAAAPKRSGWILPALGIGAAALTMLA